MPITWSHDPERRRLALTYTDPYSLEEWAEVAEAIASGKVLPCSSIFIDRRQASPPTREYVDAVTRFMAAHAKHFEGARGAVVVANAASYGMSRMVETLVELHTLYRLRVFEDCGAAEAWLDGDD